LHSHLAHTCLRSPRRPGLRRCEWKVGDAGIHNRTLRCISDSSSIDPCKHQGYCIWKFYSKNDRIGVLLFPLTRSSQERTRPLPKERKKKRKSTGLLIFTTKPDVLVFLFQKTLIFSPLLFSPLLFSPLLGERSRERSELRVRGNNARIFHPYAIALLYTQGCTRGRLRSARCGYWFDYGDYGDR